MSEQLPDVDQLPKGWITLGQTYNFLRARVLGDGDHFILDHWDCKYINARIDMRTGKVLLTPGNERTPTAEGALRELRQRLGLPETTGDGPK